MNLLLFRVAFYFILFVVSGMLNDKNKVFLQQGFLTISVSLLILWILAEKGKLKELNSWPFFIIYIISIPLIYHLTFRMFFDQDVGTKGRVEKLYILAIIMMYLSYIWYMERIRMIN
jgi:hypothetical protein